MYLLCIFIYFLLLRNAYSEAIDCIEGETWYEICLKCTCLGNGKYICTPHARSCFLGNCIENVVTFQSNFRCHCATNSTTVCVPLSYQKDLEGKPCTEDSYYYDNCIYCICDQHSKKTRCIPFVDCSLLSGGVCNVGEAIIENCYKCSCTHSKFRICSLLENCWVKKS